MKSFIIALAFLAIASSFSFKGLSSDIKNGVESFGNHVESFGSDAKSAAENIGNDIKSKIKNIVGITGGYQDFEDFQAALGQYFNIDMSSLNSCFSSLSAPAYWKLVDAETNTQYYLINGEKVQFYASAAVLKGLQTALASDMNCMLSSQAYANLNKSMTYDTIPASDLGNYL